MIILLFIAASFHLLTETKVVNLPGSGNVEFNVTLQSGYLNANENGTFRMFYILAESIETDPDTSPLVLWLNGGPGCSSVAGMFEELGPYYIGYRNLTVFKNPYSWNQRANILYLESPIGVGFSYNTEVSNFSIANDDMTAEQNFHALTHFFKTYPQFVERKFYITGESYAGVYIPMLAAKIFEAAEKFPNQMFKGIAIGNGFMNAKLSTNTLILWNAYHGAIDAYEWASIKKDCKTDGVDDVDFYDFTQFMTTKNNMDYSPDNSTCGLLLRNLMPELNDTDFGVNFYNVYSDCYYNFSKPDAIDLIDYVKKGLQNDDLSVLLNNFASDSTLAYQCWADTALTRYLNDSRVLDALGIDQAWRDRNESWTYCNNNMYDNYTMTYTDTTPFFSSIIQNLKNHFRVLIYNGDVDTACNFIADQRFFKQLAEENGLNKTRNHTPWYYEKERRRAGYFHSYEGVNLSIDVLNVKGSGHFVPHDRPGPARQMINNFLFTDHFKRVNYSNFEF